MTSSRRWPRTWTSRAATWIADRLAAHGDLEVEVVDLRDYPLPFYEEARPPAYTGRDYRTPDMARWGQTIDAADGFVIVTPEYNHGYPAALKNALDHSFVEWQRKPVAFVGYGGVGGARAIEQLRQVVVELEMAPLRHAVHILPDVMRAVRAAAGPADPAVFASLEARADLLATELVWWAQALAAARTAPASRQQEVAAPVAAGGARES
jgi:NAD(P)H-dependent FMN reductase